MAMCFSVRTIPFNVLMTLALIELPLFELALSIEIAVRVSSIERRGCRAPATASFTKILCAKSRKCVVSSCVWQRDAVKCVCKCMSSFEILMKISRPLLPAGTPAPSQMIKSIPCCFQN